MELTVNCARKTGHPHGKINKIKPIYIILHKKVNSQKNKDLNMKFETVQLLEETISSSYMIISIRKVILIDSI